MHERSTPPWWALLEQASIRDAVTGAERTSVERWMRELDFDLLIATAIRHRLLPRLADFLLASELMSLVPHAFRGALVHGLHENRFNNASTSREAERVVRALAADGVEVVCTKGVVFQASLYDGRGGRSFDDVVHPCSHPQSAPFRRVDEHDPGVVVGEELGTQRRAYA